MPRSGDLEEGKAAVGLHNPMMSLRAAQALRMATTASSASVSSDRAASAAEAAVTVPVPANMDDISLADGDENEEEEEAPAAATVLGLRSLACSCTSKLCRYAPASFFLSVPPFLIPPSLWLPVPTMLACRRLSPLILPCLR